MTITIPGIDVYEGQGVVSWQDVYNDGYQFAGIKATEGLYHEDEQFRRNWARSKLHGLQRIAYHYLRADAPGTAQADYLHTVVHANGRFAIGDGVMLDLEEMDNQQPVTVLRVAEMFVQRILGTTQAGVFLYTNYDMWVNKLGNIRSRILARCPLWLAEYGPTATPLDNWPNGLSIWQHTDAGSVPGIRGNVCLDRFYGTLDELKLLCRQGGR